jgi:hypothetical protein
MALRASTNTGIDHRHVRETKVVRAALDRCTDVTLLERTQLDKGTAASWLVGL